MATTKVLEQNTVNSTGTIKSEGMTKDSLLSEEQKLSWKEHVYTAYLQPLLTKHDSNQLLTYEDLTSSWQAANAAIGKLSTTVSSEIKSSSTETSSSSSDIEIQCFIKNLVR
jgi:hypothetical protein